MLADALSFLSMSICSWILLLFSSLSSLTFWTRVCPFFWSSNTPLALRSWFKSPWRSYRSKGYSNRHSSLLNFYNIYPSTWLRLFLDYQWFIRRFNIPMYNEKIRWSSVCARNTHKKILSTHGAEIFSVIVPSLPEPLLVELPRPSPSPFELNSTFQPMLHNCTNIVHKGAIEKQQCIKGHLSTVQ